MAKSWSQTIARGEAGAEAYQELALELRGTIWGLLDVVGLLLALRRREASALTALDRVAEQLVAFDERCAAGDVVGATVQLRAFIAKGRR